MPASTLVDPARFGAQVRELREALGLSRTQLGAEVEKSAQTIAAWEHGERVPSLMALFTVANFFGVGISVLLGEDQPAA